MTTNGDVLIGIDGGGSNTRVAVADLAGNLVAYQEHTTAASRHKDADAKENVHKALYSALDAAGKYPDEIHGIAAGIAGYDEADDLPWVEELTKLQGVACPRWHVNDAVVAHYGALVAKPGIVAIAGTGSVLFGINEDGDHIRNYDFHHYAASAARFLAYDATYEALAGNTDESDLPVVAAMLTHWGVSDLSELHSKGRLGFHADKRERNRMFGSFAPILTEAALNGSTLARTVCDRAIHQTVVGLRLLANHFTADTVAVACIGSVINSEYFQRQLNQIFTGRTSKQSLTLTEPMFPPAVGAVLYAMEQLDLPIDRQVIRNLTDSLSGTSVSGL